MPGKMTDFAAAGRTATGYLALPEAATAPETPGVLVLHAWWGLTEPFREVCDGLAQAGFVALAPDLYGGKTTAEVDEAEVLSRALYQEEERVQDDIVGAVQVLRRHALSRGQPESGKVAVVGFSMGGAYALDTSVTLAEEIAAVVTFYATYTGPDYHRARAAYLCHFAEADPYEPAESVAEMEQALQSAGRPVTSYTYPGTTHWFFEANRPDAYNASAAALAWERTVAFLNTQLR